MFEKTTLSYKDSGVLNDLVQQYLSGNKELKPYYNFFPDLKGIKELLSSHPYRQIDRSTLVSAAEKQASLVSNTTSETRAQIKKLSNQNSYTVTTGHQLCLFTGPLYFIYKILSTLNLAEQLKKDFPASDFIPVYWMASEDHDFEEVNHLHLSGKKIVWQSGQEGAVGDMSTTSLAPVKEELQKLLGSGHYPDKLAGLFEEAYLRHPTLASATRHLVNELFGRYGLVVIDGNDAGLKALFREEFRKDIFESQPFKNVSETINELKKGGFHAQVNPREINCFYMEKGLRARIEKTANGFSVVGTELTFTAAELEKIIAEKPEKISPNVTLRPVYQQKILPNIAYVGGPGELAYWLEYKKMFEKLGVFFPILMPRNFITIVDKNAQSKSEKLKLQVTDLYRDELILTKEVQARTSGVFELGDEIKQLEELYRKISAKIEQVDKTLVGSVAAELQKTLKGLESVTGKANRSLKQKAETEITQLKTILQKLFPEGIPQERYENFAGFYIKYGPDFIDSIKKSIDPFVREQVILLEK